MIISLVMRVCVYICMCVCVCVRVQDEKRQEINNFFTCLLLYVILYEDSHFHRKKF